jgi:hypothetical protein
MISRLLGSAGILTLSRGKYQIIQPELKNYFKAVSHQQSAFSQGAVAFPIP